MIRNCLWFRSVKHLQDWIPHDVASRRKPRIEINFRASPFGELVRTRSPSRLSILFAESLSLREIQSRARARAPVVASCLYPACSGVRLAATAPSSTLFSFPLFRWRVHVDTRVQARARLSTHTRSQRMGSTAAMYTRYRSAFLRGMSTRYRTLIEEHKVHNYARHGTGAPRKRASVPSQRIPPSPSHKCVNLYSHTAPRNWVITHIATYRIAIERDRTRWSDQGGEKRPFESRINSTRGYPE